MNYLSNVLIIDDTIEEAFDLQELFCKNSCIPVIMRPEQISEKMDFIPNIICCDINLHGTNDDINFKSILGLLKKIFKINKGFYIFIAWTSHTDKLEELKQLIQSDQDTHQPLLFLAMGKEDFKGHHLKLRKEIRSLLKDNKGLYACLMWNKIVQNANNETMHILYKISQDTELDLLKILTSLAKSNFGVHVLKNEALSLLKPMNFVLRDNIEKKMFQHKISVEFSKLFKNNPSLNNDEEKKVKSIANTLLHINMYPNSNKIVPGDVIEVNLKFITKLIKNSRISEDTLLEKILKKGAPKNEIIWGLCEITADCDFAQCKTKEINKFSLLYLIPDTYVNSTNKEYVTKTNICVEYNEKVYSLIIDCRFMFSLQSSRLKKNRIFNIRESLLNSYRQQIFSYNSRIGTISF